MVPSTPPSKITNLVELLRWRGEVSPGDRGFRFLENGEGEGIFLSFAELDERARAIGARLQEVIAPGDRVLLLFPPSLEYVEAFFGCLYAQAIAVPAYPPNPARLQRTLPRLQKIVADAEATVALTTAMIADLAAVLGTQAPELGSLKWIATDKVDTALASKWRQARIESQEIAFLQYTSGSTGTPKGVILDHQTLIRNMELIQEAFGSTSDDVGVNWLPLYHDMGLIGAVIQPVYCGCESVLMSPLDFLKRPRRWVEALSRFKGTLSTAPNFAYDLTVRKTPAEIRDGLDLSHWRVACNGAEPVRYTTMEAFSEYFGPAGFPKEAFMPAYGLAEVGLIVSAGRKKTYRTFEQEDGREQISCGAPLGDFDVKVVSREGREVLPEGEVGELWLRNGSVARGYWRKEEVNEEVFQAALPDGTGPYLKTGDLGCFREGEVVITGRLKDLIVIRGTNHYPQDIEATVESVDDALRRGCGAAFSIEDHGEEALVIVQEVDEEAIKDGADLIARIQTALLGGHDLAVKDVVLIKARTIEKTSSGKIQRFAARQAYENNELEVVVQGSSIRGEHSKKALHHSGKGPRSQDFREIRSWLVERVARESTLSPEEIGLQRSFASLGIDSAAAVGIVGELEEVLGREIPATALYDFPTIEALAAHLSGEKDEQNKGASKPTRETSRESEKGALAIIGMSCRFPGAAGIEAFAKLLETGEPALSLVPSSRWEPNTFSNPEIAGVDTIASDQGGFLEDIQSFDAAFFEISPREARAMDPQQRLILETAWEAIVDAGLDREKLSGSSTGVFIGQSASDFARLYQGPAVRAASGLAPSITANRLSFWLNLKGPSMVIDTACSSSLVALDQGILNLRSGRCDQAIVGGVNLILSPDMSQAFTQAGMLSPDGKCRTFDAAANGYVRGEGCGVVVVKRLEDARRDGDQIWAVIAGGAVNQDGATNGLTAPNGRAQQEVIRAALADSGVSIDEIDAIEAHGTGTELGDAIEARALGEVFGSEGAPIWLGSVKAQVGHLEAGAGMAGLIKGALMAHQRRVFPQALFESPNEACGFENSRQQVPREEQVLLRALGVSSFGFGGTNAHMILKPEGPTRPVAFAFTGQGAQRPAMGMALRNVWPAFGKPFDEALDAVERAGNVELRRVLTEGDDRIHSTGFAQPAIFAFEVALARALMASGLQPSYLIGHSIGEIAAAHIGGALSLEDGARLVVSRGALMEGLPEAGAMAAVFAAPEEVEEWIERLELNLEIGVINGARNVVISGTEEGVHQFFRATEEEGLFVKKLEVSHGFHSFLMEPMVGEFQQILSSLTFEELQIPMISALSGRVLRSHELGPSYFGEHLRKPVQFMGAVNTLLKQKVESIVEVGPAEVLTGLGRRIGGPKGPKWTALVRDSGTDGPLVVKTLASLLCELSFQKRPDPPEWDRQKYWPREGDLRKIVVRED